MRRILSVVAAVTLLAACNADRILAVFPFPVPSHLIVLNALTNALAARGHDVTVVTAMPQKNAPENLKQIDINVKKEDVLVAANVDLYALTDMNVVDKLMMLFGLGNVICEVALATPQMQDFIKSSSTDKYDVLIVSNFFHECVLGFAHAFQVPVIQVCSFGGTEATGDAVGNPHSSAYIGHYMLNHGTHMTLSQRVYNTLVGLFEKLARRVYLIPKQNDIVQKYFNGTGVGRLPHLSKLERRTSLVLLNNHVSLTYARPYVPSMIEVGGMHIAPPKKLPQDLQQFLDAAEEGVIYFSMGSNLRTSDMPAAKRDAFLQAFATLKQKVLWKWEENVLPGQPKNVKLGKWLPQSDVLAHRNVKAFITHGGLLSTQEAVYHGKPVIGIPVFGDQLMNMNQAVTAGYGLLLPYHSITYETVTHAVNTILNTPKYTESAARISRVFHDRPHTALQTAVFWSEHVMRHKGAHHLRSAALDLAWYQYYLLDVLAVLACGAALILALGFLALRTVVTICLRKKTAQDKDKKRR